MIKFKHKGNFKNTDKFFSDIYSIDYKNMLSIYGREGAQALESATPVSTGETARAWKYDIIKNKNGYQIVWSNTNMVDGIPVVILIQYGHGTKNGGYVEGIDFVNPALAPIFKKMADRIWKEVTK